MNSAPVGIPPTREDVLHWLCILEELGYPEALAQGEQAQCEKLLAKRPVIKKKGRPESRLGTRPPLPRTPKTVVVYPVPKDCPTF